MHITTKTLVPLFLLFSHLGFTIAKSDCGCDADDDDDFDLDGRDFDFDDEFDLFTREAIEYAAPPGGWGSIQYPAGTGENLPHYNAPPGGWESVKYPAGTGENLPYYAPPPGGWESVKYPLGTGARRRSVGRGGY